MAKKRRRSGKRFRLLLYERMWKRWAIPCILIVPASVALWLFTPRLFSSADALLRRALGLLPHSLISSISFLIELSAPILSILHVLYDFLALVPALIALILLVLIFLSRRTAWVQCRANHLRIQSPIYPLVISYARIKEIHSRSFYQVFDPAKEKTARQHWLRPYWGQTVLVVRITKYPVSKRWLRLWFNPYIMTPDTPGFVFLVEDWMALSRQMEDFRSTWRARRAKKRERKLAGRTW